MPSSNCCFLTCIKISQEAGKVVWYSHFFKNFPHFFCDPHSKVFSVVNEVEVAIFLEFPCFFYDPTDVGNLISGSSPFSKSRLYIWKLSVHVLLKPSLKDFEHYLASMWNESSCMIVWIFFGIELLWNWNENWTFPVSKPGFNSTWNVNFQMFKLGLEKAEASEIKLPTSTGSLKKQESSGKTSTYALLTMPKPLTVWITTNCGKFFQRWKHQTTWPAPCEICMQLKKQLELDMEQAGSKSGKEYVRLYIVTLLI